MPSLPEPTRFGLLRIGRAEFFAELDPDAPAGRVGAKVSLRLADGRVLGRRFDVDPENAGEVQDRPVAMIRAAIRTYNRETGGRFALDGDAARAAASELRDVMLGG